MTHYDKLMDVIKHQLCAYYMIGKSGDGWDEADLHESAFIILQAVEEFRDKRNLKQWRASD